jgi:hypothetical protein
MRVNDCHSGGVGIARGRSRAKRAFERRKFRPASGSAKYRLALEPLVGNQVLSSHLVALASKP